MSLQDISDIASFLWANPHSKRWAWCRSVVNRAYYSILHKVLKHLNLPSWSGHEEVARWLRNKGKAQLLMKWRTLQAMRIYADYFENTQDFTPANTKGNFRNWFSRNTKAVNSAIAVSSESFAESAYNLAQDCLKATLSLSP